MLRLRHLQFAVMAALLAACVPVAATSPQQPTKPPPPSAVAAPTPTPQPTQPTTPAAPVLSGTRWMWLEHVAGDGAVQRVKDPAKYMLEFGAGGKLGLTADCNTGGGTYSQAGFGLTLGSIVTTLAACLPESLGERYVRQLASARSFANEGDALVVMLADKGGRMTFVRAPAAAAVQPTLTPGPIDLANQPQAVQSMYMLWRQWTGEPDPAITLVSARETEWPDACFGAGRANEGCAQVVTPGYEMTFLVRGERHTVRTDPVGDRFRLVEAPEPKVGTPIVEWSGGTDAEVGACGQARIGFDGVAFGDCFAPMIAGRYIAPDRRGNLVTLFDRYGAFEIDTPAGTVKFFGKGPEKADAPTQRMISEMAKQTFFEARAGRTSASAGQAIQLEHTDASGACEVVVIRLTGEAAVFPCGGGAKPQSLQLTPARLTQLYAWVDRLALFTDGQGPEATAKPNRLSFDGRGETAATAADMAAMRKLAASLAAEMADQRVSAFEAGLVESLAARDDTLMRRLMADPFVIAHWRSEGRALGAAQALDELKRLYLGKTNLKFQPYDFRRVQFGENLGNGSTLVRTVRVTGFGTDGTLEAVLMIARKSDGGFAWHGVLISAIGLP